MSSSLETGTHACSPPNTLLASSDHEAGRAEMSIFIVWMETWAEKLPARVMGKSAAGRENQALISLTASPWPVPSCASDRLALEWRAGWLAVGSGFGRDGAEWASMACSVGGQDGISPEAVMSLFSQWDPSGPRETLSLLVSTG